MGFVSITFILLGVAAVGLGLLLITRPNVFDGNLIAGVAQVVGKGTHDSLLLTTLDIGNQLFGSNPSSNTGSYSLMCVLLENGKPKGHEIKVPVDRRAYNSIVIGANIEVLYRGDYSRARLASASANRGRLIVFLGLFVIVLAALMH